MSRSIRPHPYYSYDFDLRTGKSQTGLETCVYAIEIRFTAPQKGGGKLSNAHVWMQTPPCDPDLHWEVVEIRPVSEGNGKPLILYQANLLYRFC